MTELTLHLYNYIDLFSVTSRSTEICRLSSVCKDSLKIPTQKIWKISRSKHSSRCSLFFNKKCRILLSLQRTEPNALGALSESFALPSWFASMSFLIDLNSLEDTCFFSFYEFVGRARRLLWMSPSFGPLRMQSRERCGLCYSLALLQSVFSIQFTFLPLILSDNTELLFS